MDEPEIGAALASRATNAVLLGDEPIEDVGKYLNYAFTRLYLMRSRLEAALDEGDAKFLVAMLDVLMVLANAADRDEGLTEYTLNFKHRNPKNPSNPEKKKAINRAVAMVLEDVAMGTKQDAAIAAAIAETGVARSTIFEGLALVRWAREHLGK